MKNIYTAALLKHPIFENKKLKNDVDIKKIFDFNVKLIQEFIIREDLNEYNWNENDDDIDEHARTNQKNQNDKKNENKNNEEEDEENYSDKKRELIEDTDDTLNIESELDLDHLQIQYSLLLLIERLYKTAEHIILKFYLYHTDRSGLNNIDNIDFMEAILFLKKKNIILNEDEEQSIYLLKQLVQTLEEDFIYENSLEIDYSFLSEDILMISNISISFLGETIDNLKTIVQKIYSI